jgi:predicted Zn finger-like uncharacterized protein
MNIVCPSCQARYKFDEAKLGSRHSAKTRCAKCGGVIEIVNPLFGDEASELDAPETIRPGSVSTPAPPRPKEPDTKKTHLLRNVGEDTDPGKHTGRNLQALLELPKDRRFSLAVIQGAATGQIFPVTKIRTTLGRSGADICLDDPEASRQHAVVEILGDHAILRDVGSTNGTFVDNNRIEQEVLQNHTEFRIGSHVLMFIVTPVD